MERLFSPAIAEMMFFSFSLLVTITSVCNVIILNSDGKTHISLNDNRATISASATLVDEVHSAIRVGVPALRDSLSSIHDYHAAICAILSESRDSTRLTSELDEMRRYLFQDYGIGLHSMPRFEALDIRANASLLSPFVEVGTNIDAARSGPQHCVRSMTCIHLCKLHQIDPLQTSTELSDTAYDDQFSLCVPIL